MVEYSIINWLLIVALVISTQVQWIPTPSGNRNLVETMMAAYQNYFDSYLYLLSLPVP